jgi:hypothetical protein
VPARAATLPTGAGRRSSCKSRDRLAPSLARLTRNDRFVCGTAHPWLGSLRGRLGVLAWSGAGGFEPPFGHMLEGPRRGGLRREEDCPRQNRHPKPPQSLTTRSVGHLEREGLTDVGAKCVGLPRRQARSSSCLCVPHALDVEVEHLGPPGSSRASPPSGQRRVRIPTVAGWCSRSKYLERSRDPSKAGRGSQRPPKRPPCRRRPTDLPRPPDARETASGNEERPWGSRFQQVSRGERARTTASSLHERNLPFPAGSIHRGAEIGTRDL